MRRKQRLQPDDRSPGRTNRKFSRIWQGNFGQAKDGTPSAVERVGGGRAQRFGELLHELVHHAAHDQARGFEPRGVRGGGGGEGRARAAEADAGAGDQVGQDVGLWI